jgi:hypothetical protein
VVTGRDLQLLINQEVFARYEALAELMRTVTALCEVVDKLLQGEWVAIDKGERLFKIAGARQIRCAEGSTPAAWEMET